MRVAILKNWDHDNISRQLGEADTDRFPGIEFQGDRAEGADFIIVCNGLETALDVECDPQKLWLLNMEPPNRDQLHMHEGQDGFARIYTTSTSYRDEQHIPSISAVPWNVERSYDELVNTPYPEKTRDLSWITSASMGFPGHKYRMLFLRRLQANGLALDLFGRGFTPIEDKWDGLAPYRYSIAFENYSGGLYWTEKIADCFLTYTTPFYYGTPEIKRYFPKDSFIWIDPEDRHVFDKIRDILNSDFHEANRAALLEARHLCLNDYSTLGFIAAQVRAFDLPALPPRTIHLAPLQRPRTTLGGRLQSLLYGLSLRLRG